MIEYAGNFVYEKIGAGSNVLQFFNHPEGYVSYDGGQFNYVYNYLDHLGNIRLSYSDGNGNGTIETGSTYSEIVREKNYYPFGLEHQGYNTGGSPLGNDAAKRNGFGGKELQSESIAGSILEWYDFGARNYDAALGRWMNINPYAEYMYSYSPFNYALNNPIYFTDPDGLCPNGDCDDVGGSSEGDTTTADGTTWVVSGGLWVRDSGELDEVIITISNNDGFWSGMKELFRIKKGITYWDDTFQGGDPGGLEGTTAYSIDDSDIPSGFDGPNSIRGLNILENLVNSIRNVLGLIDRADQIKDIPEPNESSLENRVKEDAENTPEEILTLVEQTTIYRVDPPRGQQGLRINSTTSTISVPHRNALLRNSQFFDEGLLLQDTQLVKGDHFADNIRLGVLGS